MSIPSEQELQRLFDDEGLAVNVRAVEASTSWPALRILGHLAEDGPATTGDIARGLNMDMTDVRDYLDALEEFGVVTEAAEGWDLETDRIQVTVDLHGELALSYVLEDDRRKSSETAKQAEEDQDSDSWWQQLLPWAN